MVAFAIVVAAVAAWGTPRGFAGAVLRAPRSHSVAATDTVAVAGPFQFSKQGGGPNATVSFAFFTSTADTGRRYLVRTERVSGTLSSVDVRVNGMVVATTSEVQSPAGATRIVHLPPSDTIRAAVAGSNGATISVTVISVLDPSYPLTLPWHEVTGTNLTNIAVPPGHAGPFHLHWINGPGGTTRVGGASVDINGTQVLSYGCFWGPPCNLPSDHIHSAGGVIELSNLVVGVNDVFLKTVASSPGGQGFADFWITATDTTRPVIDIWTPTPNASIADDSVTVHGRVGEYTPWTVTVSVTAGSLVYSAPATLAGFELTTRVPLLAEGENTIKVHVADGAGFTADSTRVVRRDTQAPTFDVLQPTQGLITRDATTLARGPITDASPVIVTANGVPLDNDGPGFFDDIIPLAVGVNELTFVATDAAGNTATINRTVVRDTTAPALAVSAPAHDAIVTDEAVDVVGTVTDATALAVTLNGTPITPNGLGAFSTPFALAPGGNIITVAATDAAGNTSTVVRNVTRLTEPVPPDPATVAPPLDRTVATTMAAATEFLYTGANPIQTGVTSGTIDPTRVAVLRGTVKKRDGTALPGVEITILDHAEFGATRTRIDGAFDIAVNGGGPLTVDYKKSGFLPVQRQVAAPWQDYEVLAAVVMVPLDTAVATIDFSTPMQVARGSVVTDADGTRRTTVMFPQGTQATMIMPNGSTQALTSIDVRATEYTVGETGPAAMPGLLPPTSGYTYAIELSVDQALAANAAEVRFDQPVPIYVENFVDLPLGTRVPVASYDRVKSAWVPSADGRVIKVLGSIAGLATIGLDTTGMPADSAALADLGITDAERERLATLYTAGQSLWRMPVRHFSPFDGNYPAGNPPDAVDPNQQQRRVRDGCSTEKAGSILECTNQVFGEMLPITGTPIALTYRSDRTPGYRASRRQEILLTGASVPSSLLRVELLIEVAGRRFTETFPAAPNQRFTFEWDGLDAYGRPVVGNQPLTVRVGYTYPMLYLVPAEDAASFGLLCYGAPGETFWDACVIPSARNTSARLESTRWTAQQLTIGGMDVAPQRNGGWTVDVHHAYDPNARVLYYGHGQERDARDVITTVAGTGVLGTSGDGGPATQARLWDPTAIAVGRDGTVYFVDQSHQLRKVSPDGIITSIAGTGEFGYTGDGGPATQARIQWGDLGSMALGPDGSIYLAQPNFGVVRKIDPAGIITTVAGNSAIGFCVGDEESDSLLTRYACVRDGSPATEASLWGPYGVAVGPDGSIYIADGNHMVRKVSPDGIITTIAGGGHASDPCDINGSSIFPWESADCGDGGAARLAGFDTPRALAIGPDGSVYLSEFGNASVRRISPDGVVTRVVGLGRPFGFAGDGGFAVNAQIRGAGGLAVGGDGTLYIADESNRRIRRVSPDGIITTIAGTGATAPQCGQVAPPNCGSDALATQTPLNIKGPLALGPDGSVYFGTFQGDHRIRRLVPFFRSFDANGFVIASEDGAELFEFDPRGRHLRTRDALTKRILLTFGYDVEGRLIEIVDADSNVTRLERDVTGNLTAVVSPFGQRTVVGSDTRGWLARVINPAGDSTLLEHDSTGLLVSLRDPKGNPPHWFFYDSLGLLTRDENGAGGVLTVSRALTDTSVVATTTSAMGRVEKSALHFLSSGAVIRTETDAAGLVTRTEEATNGTTTITAPDGSVATITERPDPRFGMQVPVSSTFSLRMPSGLQLIGSSVRKTTLASPNDPLSLTSQTDSLVVNGRAFTSVFAAVERTLTRTSAEGRQAVTVLDSLGRVVEERVLGVAPVRYEYGARGFLSTVTQAGRTLRYDYDSSGRVSKMTDPMGRLERYAYDSAGRMVKQTLFNGREIRYGYDANGNLTSLTPPGRPAHTFAYTAMNLDSVYSPPAAGLPVSETRYAFNLDRQLTRVLRPDSLAIDVAYDTAGRPRSLALPNGQLQFVYSPTSGKLTTLTAADGGALTYAYDGAMPIIATWAGAVQGSVGFKYDNNFRVSKIAVNGADSVAFGYDNDNLLTSAGAMTLIRDPANGRPVRTVLGSDTLTWTYDDSTGAVSRYTAKHGATTLFDVAYTRDSLDRITQMLETVEGVTITKSFTYDSLGRLDQVWVDSVLASDYEYDANGNRTSLTTQTVAVAATYDDRDRMLTYGSAAFSYTINGELRTKVLGTDTTRYRYDVIGNLLQVQMPNGDVIDYLVDGQNRRIGKKVNGTLVQAFLYQGQLAPVAELDGNGQVTSRFVYGTRANVPDYVVKNGTTFRLVHDHIGTVRLAVNSATGDVAQRIDYDEFGHPETDTNPGFQPFGFAGGIYDPVTGLTRFGARDFDSEFGRWTARDPAGFNGSRDNLYTYSDNDPINSADPTGLQSCGGGCNLVDFLRNMLAGMSDAATPGFGSYSGPGWRTGMAFGLAGYMFAPTRFGAFLGSTVVIGAMEDIRAAGGIRAGERFLMPRLAGRLSSDEAYWARNAEILLREMQWGRPIRDASVDAAGNLKPFSESRFISRERALLEKSGWTYCQATRMWMPPRPLI